MHRLGTVSKNILLEGLNRFHGARQLPITTWALSNTQNRTDPSTNLVLSKLDSFSLENIMQIKSGGNVLESPPPPRKITNGCRLPYNTGTNPLKKQLDFLCSIVSPGKSIYPSVKYVDD